MVGPPCGSAALVEKDLDSACEAAGEGVIVSRVKGSVAKATGGGGSGR